MSTFTERLGRCYELSGSEVIFGDDDAVLVHGTIQREPFPRIGHAWVERDGMVHDPVPDLELPRDAYLRWANAEELVRYSKEEACKLALRFGHWGPWHDE